MYNMNCVQEWEREREREREEEREKERVRTLEEVLIFFSPSHLLALLDFLVFTSLLTSNANARRTKRLRRKRKRTK